MEQQPSDVRPFAGVLGEQWFRTGADGSSNVVIACSVGKYPIRVSNPNRGLSRKLADAVLDLIGYHRSGEPFRSRQWD